MPGQGSMKTIESVPTENRREDMVGQSNTEDEAIQKTTLSS